MQNKRNLFVTVEGIEGAGKSTAMHFLSEKFKESNIDFIITREPGGTEIAEKIRMVLLSQYHEKMSSDTELLLMFASRAQHLASVIKPALETGQWVLCDRFTDASYAYQGGGRGINVERIAQLENWVQGDLRPDVTLLMDVPVEVGMSRVQSRGAKDRFEEERLEFFNRIRQTYLMLAKQNPHRYVVIDSSGTLEQVTQQLENFVKQII